ncbi:MAG: YggS family pyridoxal phosphate-dependent enzyme [Deferribacteraceae bacterium]|jgi:pyridoxal phosphate enzyme (YggS family)|nr:YggS family pyridoxal phosphate-dependent enzyme [Deferribacteraceae bacterium]
MSEFNGRERLKIIRDGVAEAALSAGRSVDDVSILAVSKTQSVEEMRRFAALGVTAFGESRIQEALPKIEALRFLPDICFHFIGKLQSNKAKFAVGKFTLIHSVDKITLAQQIQIYAKNAGYKQDILIQINLAEETQKGGVLNSELEQFYERVTALPDIRVRGFMMIPPWQKDPEKNRRLFALMKKVFDKYTARGEFIKILSMGMSDDYKVAVQEGATMVRIGTALFGTRN